MSTITHPSFRLNFNLLNSLLISRNQPADDRFNLFWSSASRYEKWSSTFSFNILAILVTVKLALGNIKYELKNIIDLMGIVLFIRTTSFNDIKMKIALYIDIRYSEKKISEPRKKSISLFLLWATFWSVIRGTNRYFPGQRRPCWKIMKSEMDSLLPNDVLIIVMFT